MGITIDETIYCMKSYLPSDDYTHCTECKYYGCKDNKTCQSSEAHQVAIDTMRKYQMMQADYEARLKADMVAMLTEIQLEIEECVDGAEGSPQFEQGVTIARVQVVEMIQQKINVLKAESEDNV